MANDFDFDADVQTRKPKTGGFRNTSKRLREGKENHLSHRPSLDWRLDRDSVCEPGAEGVTMLGVEELTAIVKSSMTGAALFEGAGPLSVHYDRQVPMSQFYPRGEESIISLNPDRPKGDLINMMVRELRRAWQHRHGALVNPMGFEPDEAVLINRAQAADVLMISVKVAWELKLGGETEAWDYMIASPMSDVSRIFELSAQKDFRTLNNGEAARAAYDKFFENSRTRIHDKRIIHQMLLDDTGYMKAPMKNGRATMELFAKLGEMPHGRNYLTAKSTRAPNDAVYASIEDRSNANFLWFIKFERSFQEKELEMLKDSVKASAEIVDFSRWTSRHNQIKPNA